MTAATTVSVAASDDELPDEEAFVAVTPWLIVPRASNPEVEPVLTAVVSADQAATVCASEPTARAVPPTVAV